MEFTGDYYKCKYCGHMWDYMDICPNCGEDKMNTLNAQEVTEEANRLLKMLEAHGDYSPSEAKATLPINSVSQQRELLLAFCRFSDEFYRIDSSKADAAMIDRFFEANNCG
jgi:hypothetical protein